MKNENCRVCNEKLPIVDGASLSFNHLCKDCCKDCYIIWRDLVESKKNSFRKVDELALEKYNSKIPKYSDSWKDMPIIELMTRLYQEVDELTNARSIQNIHSEALDVMNIARMIAERTREFERVKKE